MSLGQWSTTAANNATADPSINWQEGQAPSTVNDSARAMMAAIATWFQAPEWINPALTPTYVNATSFTVAGNQTSVYAVGRRVRTFNTGGTLLGTITASVYAALTTVTLQMDSGSLDSGLSEVDVGIVTPGKSFLSSLINVQVFTSSGTYNSTPGASSIMVEGVGAGAAGGGAVATDSSHVSGGSGGASGSYAKARYTSGFSGGIAVTIGAGGTGVAGANGNGGGVTAFGALLTIPGGNGGVAGTALGLAGVSQTAPSTAGGAPTGSGIVTGCNGSAGHQAIFLAGTIYSGIGAASFFGGAAPGIANGTPWSGQAPGAGGGGAANPPSSSAVAGGSGAAGVVIVYEFA